MANFLGELSKGYDAAARDKSNEIARGLNDTRQRILDHTGEGAGAFLPPEVDAYRQLLRQRLAAERGRTYTYKDPNNIPGTNAGIAVHMPKNEGIISRPPGYWDTKKGKQEKRALKKAGLWDNKTNSPTGNLGSSSSYMPYRTGGGNIGSAGGGQGGTGYGLAGTTGGATRISGGGTPSGGSWDRPLTSIPSSGSSGSGTQGTGSWLKNLWAKLTDSN